MIEEINEDRSGATKLTSRENIEKKDKVNGKLVGTVIKRKKVNLKKLAKYNMKRRKMDQ